MERRRGLQPPCSPSMALAWGAGPPDALRTSSGLCKTWVTLQTLHLLPELACRSRFKRCTSSPNLHVVSRFKRCSSSPNLHVGSRFEHCASVARTCASSPRCRRRSTQASTRQRRSRFGLAACLERKRHLAEMEPALRSRSELARVARSCATVTLPTCTCCPNLHYGHAPNLHVRH